jgi:hypothetical protein
MTISSRQPSSKEEMNEEEQKRDERGINKINNK